MSMNLMICEFKFMGLQQARNDDPCLCLAKRRADARAWSTPKRNIRKGWSLPSMGETFGAEILGVLPNAGITMGKINGIKHPFASWNVSFTEFHIFPYTSIPDVNRWVQA